MAEHQIVEHTDSGTGTGMVLGIIVVLLAVVVALFFVFGGPGRFAGGSTAPSQTNVNAPAGQQAPSGPNINVPPQVDVNVNQRPAAPPAQTNP